MQIQIAQFYSTMSKLEKLCYNKYDYTRHWVTI